jgi:hypothetical protein
MTTIKTGHGYRIYMPKCGEVGVIIATCIETGFVVEFRGTPYSQWTEGESSDFCKVHDSFKRVDISRLHSDEVETITEWHGDEFKFFDKMFKKAVYG